MAKKYQREEDYIESLEQKLRDLKSENRYLNKQLKKVTRGYRKYLNEEPVEEIKKPSKDDPKDCWECSRGKLIVKVVLDRRFRECDVCGKRTKTKII